MRQGGCPVRVMVVVREPCSHGGSAVMMVGAFRKERREKDDDVDSIPDDGIII